MSFDIHVMYSGVSIYTKQYIKVIYKAWLFGYLNQRCPMATVYNISTQCNLCFLKGFGGGGEAVILAEVARNTDEDERTGIISILISVRQMGLLLGM